MTEEDGDEIKTIEQWRWSELQGLELLVSSHSNTSPPHITNPPSHNLNNSPPPIAPSSMEEQLSNQQPAKDAASPPPSVAFRQLFRFADGLDYALMTIGTVGAIVHGSSLPLFLRFFADLVNSFGSNASNVDKMSQEVLKVSCRIDFWTGIICLF